MRQNTFSLKKFFVFSFVFVSSVGMTACGSSEFGTKGTIPPGPASTKVGTESVLFTKEEVKEQKQNISFKGITLEDLIPTECGIKAYKITYETTDINGNRVMASGLLSLPIEKNSGPILSYQHGTTTLRLNVPSNPLRSHEVVTVGLTFGGSCYAIVAADYLGLGDQTNFHPYLHAQTEATATADLLSSVIPLMKSLGYTWDKNLYLAGYSQGGHATMALHRHLEQNNLFTVTASTPMAGPYDLAMATKIVLKEGGPKANIYAGYVILTLHHYYNMFKDLGEAVNVPYAAALPSLYDGTKTPSEIQKVLPLNLNKMLTPKFIESVNDENSDVVKIFKENNVYDWKPKAPVHFLHALADTDVPFANAKKTAEHMEALGADITFTDLGNFNHSTAFVPALLNAHAWYRSLR